MNVTIEVHGHNTSQARCVVERDGVEILTAHSALGSRDFAIEGVWLPRPDVAPPQDCPPFDFFHRTDFENQDAPPLVEFRLAAGLQMQDITASTPRSSGWTALWVRRINRQPIDGIVYLSYIGDFLPVGFASAIGEGYVGNSLDNTIRVGASAQPEWVLLSIQIQQVARGFGYGRAEIWSEDGVLMAEVSQSSILRLQSKVHQPRR